MKSLITVETLKISILSSIIYLNYKKGPGRKNGFCLKDITAYTKFYEMVQNHNPEFTL